MSSTNSSDRLMLLSYATIPIHDHSWRQHQWKQTETMVALASLALQSAKKLFQKGNRVGELWRHSVGGSAVSMNLVPSTKSQ